jgi:DUF1365 family protein
MVYLDLAELPGLLQRFSLLSAARFAPAAFRRSDHVGDAAQPLDESVRQLVEQQTGSRPDGPIRLLTQLRYWGHHFSPLNLYYCFPRDGGPPEAVVAEVSNTPWRERHCYVLWGGNRLPADRGPGDRSQRFRHAKAFHVSPFLGMDAEYNWRLTPPDGRLGVHIQSREADRPVFDATLNLKRTPLSDRALAANLIRFPFMTIKIVGAIYFEAFRLWLKQAPFFPHPRKRKLSTGAPAPSLGPSARDEKKIPAPAVSAGPTVS